MSDPGEDLTPSLVLRLRDGDSTAGGMLDRLYRDPVLRLCFSYLSNREEAEDATQEIFYKVLRTQAVPDQFRVWLFKIARNHCLNVVRGQRRRRDQESMPGDSEMFASWTGNLTRLVRGERNERLEEALQNLSESHREVLHLRYGEDLSREEIAEILEIPASAVKSRLYEGMKKLRAFTEDL
jgi:RNA polymerase sigma-70 factor (ECF subfamily)